MVAGRPDALVPQRQAFPIACASSSIPRNFFSADRSGVLWDMDGTLVESKQIWWHLCNAASVELGYGPLDYAQWEPTFGQSVDGYRDAFYPHHSLEEIDHYINSNFERHIEHLSVLPGCELALKAAVTALGGDKTRMAICTNSPLPIVQIVFKYCPLLREYFTPERTFCAGDSVTVAVAELKEKDSELQRLRLSSQQRAEAAKIAAAGARAGSSIHPAGPAIRYQIKAKPTGDLIFAASHALGVRSDLCLFVGDSKFDLISSTQSGCFSVGIGDKARGGHLHVDNVGQLAGKLQPRGRF